MSENILDEAKTLVGKDRRDDYGPLTESFQSIASIWNVFLKNEFADRPVVLEPWHVATLMLLLKICREHAGFKHDSWVDMAGYVLCGHTCRKETAHSAACQEFTQAPPPSDAPAKQTKPPLLYLACPYSSPSKELRNERYRSAMLATSHLMRAGFVVFSPILHTHPIAEELMPDWKSEQWLGQDKPILAAADYLAVLCLPGWLASKGILTESKWADEHNIPVVYLDPINPSRWPDTIRPHREFVNAAKGFRR